MTVATPAYIPIVYPCKADSSLQPAIFQAAGGTGPRPLVVALHTWSYDHTQFNPAYSELCRKYDFHLIHPAFRGPNWQKDACGSGLVVSDLEDAVSYMKETVNVDEKRIYLVGGSGGGHCALLMAGRRPDLWTAVSAWCPISDIAAWHRQCKDHPRFHYAAHIAEACGGDPDTDEAAAAEAKKRSPLTWLPDAVSAPLVIDISTGIHDGHTGSVPVSQAIHAYNVLAAPEDRICEADIAFICEKESVPEHLQAVDTDQDPAFEGRRIHLRRRSGKVRLTLFEGGHDLLPVPAFQWLSKQVAGQTADWSAGEDAGPAGFTAGLTQ